MWNNLIDLTFVESIWADAANIELAMLESLFTAAHELCVAYAPFTAIGPVLERYKHAEILWARQLWLQANRGSEDSFGAEGYAVNADVTLVYAAQSLLRPKTSPLSRFR